MQTSGIDFFAVGILLVAFQTAGNRGNVDKCRFACVVCRNCEFESEERSVGSLVYASHPFDFAKKCSLAAAESISAGRDGTAPESTNSPRNGI